MRPRGLFLVFLCLLPSCTSDPAAPAAGGIEVIPSVIDDPTRSGPDVSFRVENRTSGTVYLARCGDRIMAAVDRWEEGRWVTHASDACQAVLMMDPLELGPGAGATSAQAVHRAGRFRLRLGVSGRRGEAPVWNAVSPEFTIVR